MGRERLKMELIANERARKTTFLKRRKGIVKKAYEFSTLCELDLCMIIYGPKQTDRPPELHTWPENPNEVNRIINRYKDSTMLKPAKKTFNLSDMLMERKTKVHVDACKARKEIYEVKYPTWDERINSFTEDQLEDLLTSLDSKLECGKITLLNKRKETAEQHQYVFPSSQNQPCNYYYKTDQDNHEGDQKPISSLNYNMVNMLQSFPASFGHHHHHQSFDHQMLQCDNSNEYLNNLSAPNPGLMAMWMLMESKYNYSFQLSAGTSNSNSQIPLEGYHNNFNGPVIQSTVENMNMMMFNNNISPPSSSSIYQQCYAQRRQPTVPSMQYPMMQAAGISSHQVQVHASEVTDDQYEDVNQYFGHE